MITPVTEAELVDSAIRHIVMASREELMSYFKGTCISRVVTQSLGRQLVYFHDIAYGERTNYFYQRREYSNTQPKRLYLDQIPILEVGKAPDTVAFYPGVMQRSPEFQMIDTHLRSFFKKYLAGIKVTENTKSEYNKVNNGKEDKTLIIGLTQPQVEETGFGYVGPDLYPVPPHTGMYTVTWGEGGEPDIYYPNLSDGSGLLTTMGEPQLQSDWNIYSS